jgi:hypothetical protein
MTPSQAPGRAAQRPGRAAGARPLIRAGVIWNPRSRHNIGREGPPAGAAGVRIAAPENLDEIAEALADFAKAGLDLLVIDGGDGAVREVLSRAPEAFGRKLPRFAVLPSGKTNALALDLGAPRGWRLQGALEAARAGRTETRRAFEIVRKGARKPELRGFIFGAGAFVTATHMAQRTHSAGAFGNAAVALTMAGATVRTLFGGKTDDWSRGEMIELELAGAPRRGSRFVLMASTLKRLPLGLKPFGEPRLGLKVLVVDAPPRRLPQALPIIAGGRDAAWLEAAGYHRADVDALPMVLDGEFVLDGEIYPGGALTLRHGPAFEFVRP